MSISRQISTRPGEPSLTFYPDQSAASVIPAVPDIEGLAGGAHFNAAANLGKQLEDAGSLKRTVEYLDSSDVKLHGRRKRVVLDVLECYCCKPSIDIFRRSWREDSVFEDNAFMCKGYTQVAAQTRAFSKARTLSANVLQSTTGPTEPNQIVYEQSQEYTIRFLNIKKVVTSLITLDLDENDKILKLTDRWSGNDPPNRFGAYYLRRLSGKSVSWFISIPKYHE
ncbi:hypothetical protein FRB94_008956 [Tulasnella sp. JGI-2019a]|nr:hypothetical protein FRB94_008956 [Tulasnella sp. JGI-2019a]KAG9040038.1 hypothetical protein FRB95_004510 [Tulasnella sp. JGI-2019a]